MCLSGQGQKISGEVRYAEKIVSLGVDTTTIDDKRVKNIILTQMKEGKKALSEGVVMYKLRFNNEESLFEPINLMQNDGNPNLKRIQSKSIFYFNKTENIKLRPVNIFNRDYIIIDTVSNHGMNWKITKGFKSIAGYKCREASTTIEIRPGVFKNVKAWFTKDIPINFGPRGYSGLPGLILGIEENGHFYFASTIKLNERDIIIEKPINGINISIEEYDAMVQKAIRKMRGKN